MVISRRVGRRGFGLCPLLVVILEQGAPKAFILSDQIAPLIAESAAFGDRVVECTLELQQAV